MYSPREHSLDRTSFWVYSKFYFASEITRKWERFWRIIIEISHDHSIKNLQFYIMFMSSAHWVRECQSKLYNIFTFKLWLFNFRYSSDESEEDEYLRNIRVRKFHKNLGIWWVKACWKGVSKTSLHFLSWLLNFH